MTAFSTRDSDRCRVVASAHANRKSHPFHAWLAQAEEIRTRRDASEIDVNPQDHNVIFEFSRRTCMECSAPFGLMSATSYAPSLLPIGNSKFRLLALRGTSNGG